MQVFRYEEDFQFTTPREPLQDLLVQIGFLRSRDYVVELMATRHGATKADASARAKRIAPYVTLASDYVQQTLSTTSEVAYLSGYYAILNLLKIYILLSRQHAKLEANRWHGASYDVYGKDSHGLLTELVTLRSGGAIPLVYNIITGRTIPDKSRVRLGDVYPFIADVGSEWEIATGAASSLAQISFNLEVRRSGRHPVLRIDYEGGAPIRSARDLPLLSGYRRDPADADLFVGPSIRPPASGDDAAVRRTIRPWLIYHPDQDGACRTLVCSRQLTFPEELSIAIAFFHLSSVVRYKPEFMAKLRDSRHWPVIAAARSHALYKFLVLFWSYVQQRAVIVHVRA